MWPLQLSLDSNMGWIITHEHDQSNRFLKHAKAHCWLDKAGPHQKVWCFFASASEISIFLEDEYDDSFWLILKKVLLIVGEV